jgi:putative phage-type endonuclease
MIQHKIDQNTDEWMNLRCAKLTASQFKTCFMGKSTKGFKDLVYTKRAELKTKEIEESFSNFWTERGHELEPLARESYEIETFTSVEDAGFWEYSKYIGASPDGLVGDDGLIEIKCPKASTVERYLDQNKLPAEYYWQVHGQMMCTGRKWVDFVVYHPKYEIFILRVNRDESIIEELKEKLNEVVNLILKK